MRETCSYTATSRGRGLQLCLRKREDWWNAVEHVDIYMYVNTVYIYKYVYICINGCGNVRCGSREFITLIAGE